MSETTPEALPEATVVKKRRLSGVWLIPIVAAIIGGWLTYKAVSEKGPAFTLTFRSAEGLEAGKTKIKYRELELGVVETLTLSENLDHVVATARLAPAYEKFLTEKTRFWVVRARVSAGRVTGLGTLLSGAFIGIDPVADGARSRAFEGLEVAPLVTSEEAGTRFILTTRRMGSLEAGAPIFYHQVQVGEVTRTTLDDDGESVTVDVFVRSPHDARVRANTRWWNAGGFDATINQDGLRIETESFVSMIIGGLAFDSPPGAPVDAATPGQTFDLYTSKAATVQPIYNIKLPVMAYFDGSVKGLTHGSVVELQGIQIGRVIDVQLEYIAATGNFRVPVVMELEPERIVLLDEVGKAPAMLLETLLKKGLKARLESGNLLTGGLVVNLDFHDGNSPETGSEAGAGPVKIERAGNTPIIPTVPKRLDQLAANVGKLVSQFEKVPLAEMGREIELSLKALRGTLEHARAATRTTNRDVLPMLTATVTEARNTLQKVQATLGTADKAAKAAGRMVGPTSQTTVEIQRLLIEVTAAMRSMRLLTDHLERNPEDLIKGRKDP